MAHIHVLRPLAFAYLVCSQSRTKKGLERTTPTKIPITGLLQLLCNCSHIHLQVSQEY